MGALAPHHAQNLAPGGCSFFLQLGQTTIMPQGSLYL